MSWENPRQSRCVQAGRQCRRNVRSDSHRAWLRYCTTIGGLREVSFIDDSPRTVSMQAGGEMLVEALEDFEGTMLFVSHDRTFLRGLANRVLELAGEEHNAPLKYGGSYEEYVERTGREAPGVQS